MTDTQKPTLEELDKDLLFVEAEMANARDLGNAVHCILFNLILELDRNGVIDGNVFCSRLINLVPSMKPEGAKIALNLVMSEIMSKLPRDGYDA